MVAINDNGTPTAVPKLEIRNRTDQRRFDNAVLRLNSRLAFDKAQIKDDTEEDNGFNQ